jgi:hypothetical protein
MPANKLNMFRLIIFVGRGAVWFDEYRRFIVTFCPYFIFYPVIELVSVA